jgi:hypothetical protein
MLVAKPIPREEKLMSCTTCIRWISIKDATKDRWPEDRQRVLTYCPRRKYANVDVSISVHTFYEEFSASRERWFIGDTNHLADEMDITHWAKLPRGPEVDNVTTGSTGEDREA